MFIRRPAWIATEFPSSTDSRVGNTRPAIELNTGRDPDSVPRFPENSTQAAQNSQINIGYAEKLPFSER
jgi:hypothetical protein